jgi:iron complex transport system ATP-binding protein
MGTMLDIQNLHVAYGNREVLRDIDLQVNRGEVVALIGPNGAGKTTLIRAASGTIPVCGGGISVQGEDVSAMTAAQRARLLSVVPQAGGLPGGFTVWHTVLLGRTPYLGWLGRTSAEDSQRVEWALGRANLLELASRSIGELSGGEQQRVLLARALAQDTPVLLLDEPTAHLDLKHQSSLLNLVHQLAHESGLAVLMALHDLNLAGLYADRVALLAEGTLQAAGTPGEVLTAARLTAVYQVPVHVVPHPDYGTPLVLPDGRFPA